MATDFLIIGLLQSPYALSGELKVQSLSNEKEHFFNLRGKEVLLQKGEQVQRKIVEEVREVLPHLLIKFKGIDSPEAAKAFSSWELKVDRSLASPLAEGEYYFGDLIGCEVFLKGTYIAKVKSVWENGAYQILELVLKDGSLRQVPFLEVFIGSVEPDKGRIELLADWILE